MIKTTPRAIGLTFCLLAFGASAFACNIPVFRYALERWRPDRIRLTVYTDAERSAETQRVLAMLRSASVDQGGSSNFELQLVEIDPEGTWPRTLPNKDTVELPWATATGRHPQGEFTCWSGQLQADSVQTLLKSPARAELAKRLSSGDAVVWVILKSPDDEQNADLRKMLDESLAKLSEQLELPEGIGLPGSELFSNVPLLLQFSVLEIDHGDAREGFIRNLAEGFQPEAFKSGEPLVIPVFGRGRALEVIPGSQIEPGLVRGLTEFLCGACSCQVKDQNPGLDLLCSFDWEEELFDDASVLPPAAESISPGQKKSPVLLTIPPGR